MQYNFYKIFLQFRDVEHVFPDPSGIYLTQIPENETEMNEILNDSNGEGCSRAGAWAFQLIKPDPCVLRSLNLFH